MATPRASCCQQSQYRHAGNGGAKAGQRRSRAVHVPAGCLRARPSARSSASSRKRVSCEASFHMWPTRTGGPGRRRSSPRGRGCSQTPPWRASAYQSTKTRHSLRPHGRYPGCTPVSGRSARSVSTWTHQANGPGGPGSVAAASPPPAPGVPETRSACRPAPGAASGHRSRRGSHRAHGRCSAGTTAGRRVARASAALPWLSGGQPRGLAPRDRTLPGVRCFTGCGCFHPYPPGRPAASLRLPHRTGRPGHSLPGQTPG